MKLNECWALALALSGLNLRPKIRREKGRWLVSVDVSSSMSKTMLEWLSEKITGLSAGYQTWSLVKPEGSVIYIVEFDAQPPKENHDARSKIDAENPVGFEEVKPD